MFETLCLKGAMNLEMVDLTPGGFTPKKLSGTEVPLGWVAIFELRYRDGSRFLPFGIRMGRNFCHLV